MRIHRHLTVLSALLVAAGTLAGTAWTRDDSRIVSYACPSGEQFTVEYLNGHVRLRTGAGIFALSHETSESGDKYSDGNTVFSTSGPHARLDRPGLPSNTDCSIRSSSL